MSDKNKLAMEIIEPDKFWSVISFLPNPANMLSDRGSFYSTVEEMLLDAKIGSLLKLRKDIVTSFPYVIEQKDSSDQVYQFIKDNLLKNLNWENDVKEWLTGIENGFSFGETLWNIVNGYKLPDSLRNKLPQRIGFKTDYEIVSGGKRSIWLPVDLKQNKVLKENYKFLIYRNNPRAENPYGTSDLLMCYWPWKFKQFGWEFWLEAARKAGVPSLAALFDVSDPKKAEESAKIISETLEEAEGGSGLALANVKDIKVIAMSGVLADHKVLIDTCNQEISFALTSQSLSTQEGVYGTRAQATVHDENLVRSAHGDARAVNSLPQQLIDWTVELNFGKGVPSPKGNFDLEKYATFDEVMKAIQAKIPVSKESLYTRYGLPKPKDKDDTFLTPEPTNPSIFLSDNPLDKKKARRVITIT